MRSIAPLAAPLAAVALALPAGAQKVGTRVPHLPLIDFTGVQATSFDDFVGRAVLLEYFAYW